MVVIAGPIFSSGSGSKQLFNYHDPDDTLPVYRDDLNEMNEYMKSIKDRGALYAHEAEEFVRHLKHLICNKALHDDLHNALWPVMKSVKALLAMKPFDENGKVNPEFQSGLVTLDKKVARLSSHRNTRLLVGSIFALLTAITIAAAVAIAVLIPGAQIFAPLLLGAVSLKPALFAGVTFSDAYKAHGLLKRVNPMITAMKQETPKLSHINP